MGKLGKYVNIRTGKLNANASVSGGEYPFFTCAVKSLRINKFAFDCECVLVAGNGDLNVKYYKGKFNAYQRTYIIECKDRNMLNTKYLKLYLDKALDKLRLNTKGGIIQYIRLSDLTNLEIILPSIIYQKQIAKVLSDCEILIKKRKESICLLDELIRSTFLEMFGDVLNNSKNWPLKKVEEIIVFKRGYDLPKKDRRQGSFPLYSANGQTDSIDKFKVKGPGIITGRSGSIGFVHYVLEDYWPLNTSLYSEYYDGNPIYLKYLLAYFRLDRFANGGGVPTLNRNIVHKKYIINVPKNMQDIFASIIEKIERIKKSYNNNLNELENLYGSISQQAFKGELDLSKVDISDMEEINKDTDSVIEPIGENKEEEKVTIQDSILKLKMIITDKFSGFSFSFNDLKRVNDENAVLLDYEQLKEFLFDSLEGKSKFLEQIFDEDKKEIVFKIAE